MSASSASARHETRALLRAHLAAASGYRHLTRHCPICHRLLRLALEPSPHRPGECEVAGAGFVQESAVREALEGESAEQKRAERGEDESPAKA
ncbi:hypothetical protein DMA15_17795 [Streptomyces sp. WAC 01529]|uniref:DUF6274 family protein n=1 Tax=Streptomyces sp. WAC 01529 TaxID=2203205 RepID=UPI000F6D0BCD|nr:DUF6274 family protein [Streptomyces sp. WAC 01529]AZM54192.1 hypothetical protein DMA15_17795 [Streptomyces sp. WAC 01529]